MNKNIGYKIKELREQKNISQENLAFQLDVSQSYLSKIENGTIEKLDFLFMQKVAEFFKVEPQYFMDDQIFQNIVDNNHSSAFGNPYSTITINNTVTDDLVKSLVQNQEQISQLMEMQNRLIEQLLKK
ncbi:helix-turn-helix domain-containing protein [Chryseobacterium mulctrae]|uniref:helix-turn-helix domain-containing protein n=1 Tax=Chryseobacterium mulctrae TaxID=2576777 RepID=UPI0011179D7C|nr:helix-turn-helix transcriptional regulator [Chryseobacterium mulctrae]